MKLQRGLLGVVLALLLVAGVAVADESVNAPTITGETGYFSLFTGDTLPQGAMSFGIYYNNWDRVFEFDDTADLDWNRLSASFGYGFTDDFEMSVMVPYENLDADFPGSGSFDDDGLGNVRVGAKYSFYQDEDRSFALNAYVEAPTGDEEVLGGETGYGVGLAWRRASWVYNVGYSQPGDFGPDGSLDRSDALTGGIGYAGEVSEQFNWITELVATVPLDSDDAIFEESVDLNLGGRYWLAPDGPWAFNFALRSDLMQLSDTDEHCPIGGLLGFTYVPRFFTAVPPPPPPPPPTEYELTVETAGDCEGQVVSSPSGIDCGADCDAMYEEGTIVTLRATPVDDNCEVTGWTGDADCEDGEVTMNGDRYCVANFASVAPPPPAAPKFTEVERVCMFGSNSSRVNNPCKAILDEVALLMRDNPDAPALVIGYSDSSGPEGPNMEMSKRRAEAVKNWLVTRHAVDPSRITVEGRGETDEFGTSSKDNRRAVIRVTVEEDM